MKRLAALGAALAWVAASAAAEFDTVIEYTLRNTAAVAVTNPELRAYLPPYRQGRLESAGEHVPLRAEETAEGLLLHRPLPALAPYQTVTLRVAIARDDYVPPAATDPARYLAGDAFAPRDHPAVAAVGQRLLLDPGLAGLRRAADWVRGHVDRFERTAARRGALYALEKGRGDCTEQADLTIALLRGADVPARLVSGYTLDGTGRVAGAVRHDWVEAWVGNEWVLVDPLNDAVAPERARYLPFRYHRPYVEGAPGFHLFAGSPTGVEVSMRLLRVPATAAPLVIADYAGRATLQCKVPDRGDAPEAAAAE